MSYSSYLKLFINIIFTIIHSINGHKLLYTLFVESVTCYITSFITSIYSSLLSPKCKSLKSFLRRSKRWRNSNLSFIHSCRWPNNGSVKWYEILHNRTILIPYPTFKMSNIIYCWAAWINAQFLWKNTMAISEYVYMIFLVENIWLNFFLLIGYVSIFWLFGADILLFCLSS